MNIRLVNQNDIPALSDIVKRNYNEEYAAVAHNEIQDMFKDITIKYTYLLAETNNEILGFAGYAQSQIDWQGYTIFRVNVAPEHQGQGVATAILTEVIDNIKSHTDKHKAAFILLTAIKTNLYERLGFKIIHTFLGEGNTDNYLMLLDLSL